MEADERIRKACHDAMQREIERSLYGNSWVTTSTAEEPKALRYEDLCRDWAKWMAMARREQVVFVVEAGFQGDPIKNETMTEGVRIEMSYATAAAVHEVWPLKLDKIISEDCAEFVPVSGVFHEWVSKILPPPPYELPDDAPPFTP